MSSPETPRDNPESLIQKELDRLRMDRSAFLVESGLTEIELKSIIQRPDVQAMFRTNLESPEVPNLNALQSIMSGVLVGYQSTGNVPSSISEMASKPIPQSATPEVRLAHWKLRQIAKLGNTHPTFQNIDNYWKNLQKPSLQAFTPKIQGETEQGYLERAKGFVGDHPVASTIVGIGGAALLYKLFGSSDKEGSNEKDKGFFQSILDKVPSMGFLGTLVSLIGIWYFFGDKIRGIFDTGVKTIEVAGKTMEKAKVIEKIFSSETSLSEKGELIKSLIEQDPNGKSIVEKIAGSLGIDISKWNYQGPKKQSNEGEHTGNLEVIGLARASQFYYGTWKPWKDLNTSEKAIMQGTVSGWMSGWFSKGNINHSDALGRVSGIEAEIKTLEATLPTKTTENLTKLSTGNGAFEGKDWKDALKLEHIEKQVKINNAGALPLMFSGLDNASKNLIAEHFAKQEIDILIQAQRTLVDAIKAGPAEYGKFLASKGDTTLLYDRMRTLEAKRFGLNLDNLHGIIPDDWKKFTELADEHLSLIKEKDAILGGKRDRMLEIQREITQNPSRKTLLETEFQKLAKEYAEVENDVVRSTNEMLTKEKSMVRVLENAGLSHASWNPLHHFMVSKGWIAQGHHAETLDNLRMVSPGKSGLLRMGFSKGNFVLMGVGVGAVMYANGGIMNEGAKHDLSRMAWGLVPVIGGSMDIQDAWKDFKGGNIMHGVANLGAATASFTGDALLALSLIPAGTTAPLGIGAKGAMYGLRNFIKGLGVEGAQSVVIKEALPESGKIVLSVTDASGKIVDKTVDLTPEGKNAWKWIHERMAPQRENIAKYAKMGLIGGIGTMLVAGPGYMLASYAFDKDGNAQKIM